MQKNLVSIVVAAVLLLSASTLFWVGAVRESSAAQNSETSAVRWEYLFCDGNGTGSMSPLNELGKDGWELVSTVCDSSAGGNGSVRHYLKRKLP